MFNYHIIFTEICLIDGFILLFSICFGKIDIYRHERTVFLDNLSHTIFIGKLQAFLIEEKSDLCSRFCFVSVCHLILRTTVTGPMYRCGTLLVRESINMNFICNHKCRIKSKSEMTDHLIIRCFILIFLKKLCGTGKSDLCDIFLYFICCHTNTVIDKLQGFLIRINDNIYSRFVTFRECIISHNFQLSQFGDRIASVGDHLSYKNIMVGI